MRKQKISSRRMCGYVTRKLHDGRGYIEDGERDRYAAEFKEEYMSMTKDQRKEADMATEGFLIYYF